MDISYYVTERLSYFTRATRYAKAHQREIGASVVALAGAALILVGALAPHLPCLCCGAGIEVIELLALAVIKCSAKKKINEGKEMLRLPPSMEL